MEPTDTPHDHKALVARLFAAMARRDAAALSEVITDDVAWWIPQSAVAFSGLARPLRDKPAVLALFQTGFYTDTEWRFEHLVAEGDLVAVHTTMRGRTRAGQDYENQYHFLVRVRDGLVAEVWEHLDTAYAFSRIRPDGS